MSGQRCDIPDRSCLFGEPRKMVTYIPPPRGSWRGAPIYNACRRNPYSAPSRSR